MFEERLTAWDKLKVSHGVGGRAVGLSGPTVGVYQRRSIASSRIRDWLKAPLQTLVRKISCRRARRDAKEGGGIRHDSARTWSSPCL